ncbi:hypothetical protein LC040_02745 [Bacillus tianshenii]|nr:hypothetical protein LC040_02745 [Bacillus tianshenii]
MNDSLSIERFTIEEVRKRTNSGEHPLRELKETNNTQALQHVLKWLKENEKG